MARGARPAPARSGAAHNDSEALAAERAANARMREMLSSMAAGVLLLDAEGRIQQANPAAAAMSGLKPEDVVGQLAADPAWQLTDEHGQVLPYDALPVPTALREKREVRGVELGVPTLAGPMRWMRVNVVPLFEDDGSLRGAVATTEDVTERHVLAEQLLQAQKLEGIGQLAGGVAHDFNNLLTVIVGNAELALRAVAPDSLAATEIVEIRDAAQRGGALTRQMLTFARKQVVQPRAVRLDQLAVSMEALLRRMLGEHIVLQRATDEALWPVRVDPGQMEQVLVNMAINARDAMPQGGELTVETRNARVDAELAQAHPGVEPGDFVVLSIRDTGSGIAPDVVGRVFEPFFTTKPIGSGTGLGLSICHSIVKQARGFISLETAPRRGTTFGIWLPRAVDEHVPAAATVARAVPQGRGRILLVEDQDSVRSFVERALVGYGYEVVSAGGGSQGVAAYERAEQGFDLLLTDVVMPDMGGIELAAVLRTSQPDLPVLYMTGYLDTGNGSLDALELDERSLLLKPFTPMQLAARVSDLLSEAAQAR